MVNTHQPKNATIDVADYSKTRRWLGYGFEFMWLFTLLVVPLVFNGKNYYFNFTQPKQHILHFTSLLVVILWVFEAVLLARIGTLRDGRQYIVQAARTWLTDAIRNPYHWGILFLVAFLFAHLFALLVSPSPFVSFAGRDANDPGNELYTTLTILVFCFTLALRIRSVAQVERILVVIAAVGVITAFYGLVQFLGTPGPTLCTGTWDVLGCGAGLDRVYSTYGNPIFFSAYLLLSSLATIGVAWLYSTRGYARYAIPIGVLAASFQVIMSYSTTSRGPIVGLGMALFLMLVITLMVRADRRTLLKTVAVTIFAIGTWLVMWLGGNAVGGTLLSLIVLGLGYLEYREGLGIRTTAILTGLALGTLWAALTFLNIFGFLYDFVVAVLPFGMLLLLLTFRQVFKRLGVILCLGVTISLVGFAYIGDVTNTLGQDAWRLHQDVDPVAEETLTNTVDKLNDVSTGRIQIWTSALELLQTREVPPGYDTTPTVLRHIFGYGQEMYFMSYPLALPGRVEFRIAANAHNLYLHVLLEQGVLGLLTFGGLLLAVAWTLFRAIRRGGADIATYSSMIVLLVVLSAILAGRYFEQLFGLARISDNFTVWSLLGTALAFGNPEFIRLCGRPKRAIETAQRPVQRRGRHPGGLLRVFWVPIVAAFVAGGLALTLFIMFDVQAIQVSTRAVNGYKQAQIERGAGNVDAFISEVDAIQAAIVREPQSELYLTQYFEAVQVYLRPAITERNYLRALTILDKLDEAWQAVDKIHSGSYNNVLVSVDALVNRHNLIRALNSDISGVNGQISNLQSLVAEGVPDAAEQLAQSEHSKVDLEAVLATAEATGNLAELETEIRTRIGFMQVTLAAYPTVINFISTIYLQLNDWEQARLWSTKGVELAFKLNSDPLEFHILHINATYFGQDYEATLDTIQTVLDDDVRYPSHENFLMQAQRFQNSISTNAFSRQDYALADRANALGIRIDAELN